MHRATVLGAWARQRLTLQNSCPESLEDIRCCDEPIIYDVNKVKYICLLFCLVRIVDIAKNYGGLGHCFWKDPIAGFY